MMMSFFEMQFWAFLIDVRKHKSHFWNHETKLDKIGIFVVRKF